MLLSKRTALALALGAELVSRTGAFVATTSRASDRVGVVVSPRLAVAATDDDVAVRVPLTYDEMVADAAAAVDAARADGVDRQIVRLLLPRDPSAGDLGTYYESDASTSSRSSFGEAAVLVPPDETWQGGIMQLYRAAAPTCVDVLRSLGGAVRGGVPPRVTEDRSIDESGVDGCGLLTTAVSGENVDGEASKKSVVSCVVQPTQEIVYDGVVDDVCRRSAKDKDDLVLLVNPQWRNIDDALDSASKNTNNLFGKLASFIGGKGGVLNKLDELGFANNVYTIEGYVCKGGNIRLVKRFDSDWVVFAENDSLTNYVQIGTSASRPTYQDCDKMLDERGVGLKYARDIGLAPKFEE